MKKNTKSVQEELEKYLNYNKIKKNTLNILLTLDINSKILDLSNKKIKGILHCCIFENLKELNCSNNQISELLLPFYLENIDCSNNKIVKLFLSDPKSISKYIKIA